MIRVVAQTEDKIFGLVKCMIYYAEQVSGICRFVACAQQQKRFPQRNRYGTYIYRCDEFCRVCADCCADIV